MDKQAKNDAAPLNLYQKLLKITEEVGKIEKTGRNTQQGYAFIEQAQVMAELRPQFAKWGVFIQPETVSRTIERYEVTRSNGKQGVDVHANVVSRYTVINADNPDEKFVCEWDAGEAIDSSDKATNKATTASHKYFLMKLFNISDKDDSDNDSPEPPAPRTANMRYATDKQIQWIRDTARKLNDQLGDNEETDKWIESILTIPPQKVPIFKVKDAVDKLKGGDEPAPSEDVVVTDIPDEINLDNLPY